MFLIRSEVVLFMHHPFLEISTVPQELVETDRSSCHILHHEIIVMLLVVLQGFFSWCLSMRGYRRFLVA